jgi:hypothetical protein
LLLSLPFDCSCFLLFLSLRCEKLPSSSIVYGLSMTILILAIWYQLLLFKAMVRQLIIFYNIKTSLNWIENENEEQEEINTSRQNSIDPASQHDNSQSLLQPVSNNDDDGDSQDQQEHDDVLSPQPELVHLVKSRLAGLSSSRTSQSQSQENLSPASLIRSHLSEREGLLKGNSSSLTFPLLF